MAGNKNYISSFSILQNNDYSIVLLEECKTCENKEQLLARERHYIDSLQCVNMAKPLRTGKEWYYDNFEKIKEQKKDYYKQNIQRSIDYRKENSERIKETKHKYYELHKQEIQDKKKLYVEENKSKVSQQRKLKYQENKASILEKQKEVINCPDCGTSYTKCHKSRHIKSQRHLNSLKDIIC